MQTKTFYASCMKQEETVALGRQMEDNYRAITFDLSGFGLEIDRAMIVHQRKADAAPYVVTSVTGGNSITWTVTNTDTAYSGRGEAEIRIEFTNGLAKSVVFQTVVIRSITADTEIPAALQSWYDAMIDYIDDHSVSPEQIEQAVADYLDEHPVQAPVTSVNSKIGAVVLTASDVGALSDQVTIPTKTSELTNDSGFITSVPVTSVNAKTGAVVLSASDVNALPSTTTAADLGAYVKPSGGIPKTDLASDVQTSLGKADTALQSAPVTSVNGATGDVVIANATTSAAGLMSATDKSHLDAVYADYSSALTALGVS